MKSSFTLHAFHQVHIPTRLGQLIEPETKKQRFSENGVKEKGTSSHLGKHKPVDIKFTNLSYIVKDDQQFKGKVPVFSLFSWAQLPHKMR